MRRLIIEEPVSRAAVAAWRISLFSLPVLIAGILLVRLHVVELNAGMSVIGAASILAFSSMVYAVVAFVKIWTQGRKGVWKAIRAFGLASIVLAYPSFLMVRLTCMPYLSDLSTDVERPPAFSRSSVAMEYRAGYIPGTLREAELLDPSYPAAQEAYRDQRRAYPDFGPKKTGLAPDVVYARALKAAQEEKWQIIDSTPPGGRFGMGHIDAVKYTPVLKLPIDITVRLRTHALGTTIDMRSVPRYPILDWMISPKFIENYLEKVAPADGISRG